MRDEPDPGQVHRAARLEDPEAQGGHGVRRQGDDPAVPDRADAGDCNALKRSSRCCRDMRSRVVETTARLNVLGLSRVRVDPDPLSPNSPR